MLQQQQQQRDRAASCAEMEEQMSRARVGRAFSFLYARMTGSQEEAVEFLPGHADSPVMPEGEVMMEGVVVDGVVVDGLALHQQKKKKQRWVARAVMIVAFIMFLMSVALVAVTLALTDHFDEMVRQMNTMEPKRSPFDSTAQLPTSSTRLSVNTTGVR